jgi:glucose-1-phosphate adenylyltransferase
METAPKMLPRTQAFILAGGQGERLLPLTRGCAKPAVAFGGVHRLIDFTLSNCFNSGITRIRILTQYQCESLHSYIRALTRRSPFHKNRDESVLCLCPAGGKRFCGTADAVFQNLGVFGNEETDVVLILAGDHVYRMDYRDLLRFHSTCGAEVTVAAVEWPFDGASQFGVLEADSGGHVVSFQEKPHTPKTIFTKPSRSLVSMGVYVFNMKTLIDALGDDARDETGHDFGKDIIPGLVRGNVVSAYNFTEASTRLGSYWRDVGTVEAYYRANMELLLSPFLDPYQCAEWPLYSLEPGRHPGFVSREHHGGSVLDSVLARGVSIGRGSHVVHSVLSPGVRIKPCAEIRNSILLHNVQVGAGARIQRAILDENVRIADEVEAGYNPGSDRKYGHVTDTGIVVIPRNTYVGPEQMVFPSHAKWKTKLIAEDRIKSQQEW